MFFQNRLYGNKVLMRAPELIAQELGEEDAEEAIQAFATFTRGAMRAKSLNLRHLARHLRKSGYSHDAAAVVVIDGTITQMKEAQNMPTLTQTEHAFMGKLIESLERVVDGYMRGDLRRREKFLPRNGRFAEAAHSSGFDKYYRQ